MKRLPWLSLALLLVAYSTFGWFLFDTTSFRLSILLALGVALVLSGTLTAPPKSIRGRFLSWTVSSAGALISVITVAFFVAVILFLLQIFIHISIVISAEILVRLDMQTAGFSSLQAFLILTGVSLAGLELGWALHRMF